MSGFSSFWLVHWCPCQWREILQLTTQSNTNMTFGSLSLSFIEGKCSWWMFQEERETKRETLSRNCYPFLPWNSHSLIFSIFPDRGIQQGSERRRIRRSVMHRKIAFGSLSSKWRERERGRIENWVYERGRKSDPSPRIRINLSPFSLSLSLLHQLFFSFLARTSSFSLSSRSINPQHSHTIFLSLSIIFYSILRYEKYRWATNFHSLTRKEGKIQKACDSQFSLSLSFLNLIPAKYIYSGWNGLAM